MTPPEIIEVLKYPAGVGRAQDIFLNVLEEKTQCTFDGKIGSVVNQASSLGLFDEAIAQLPPHVH